MYCSSTSLELGILLLCGELATGTGYQDFTLVGQVGTFSLIRGVSDQMFTFRKYLLKLPRFQNINKLDFINV